MTALTKPITREIDAPRALGVVRKPLVITIDPAAARISFHEKGCRTAYHLPILTAYLSAIRLAKEEEA